MNATLHRLEISLLPGRYAICKAPPDSFPPSAWATPSGFLSVTRTAEEISGVCEEESVPPDVRAERGRKLFRVQGPLAFSLTGVLASLANPLAQAGIGIFVLSTYDTDYFLVAECDAELAISALERAGHTIYRSNSQ